MQKYKITRKKKQNKLLQTKLSCKQQIATVTLQQEKSLLQNIQRVHSTEYFIYLKKRNTAQDILRNIPIVMKHHFNFINYQITILFRFLATFITFPDLKPSFNLPTFFNIIKIINPTFW